jgi:1-acyl-sn-glycerol-3-phosphate acyltransferase
VILARSLLFNVLFYANLIVHMIVALPALVLPYPALRIFIRSYSRTSLWLLRVVCGIRVAWRGTDKIPRGACIVASKHQSAWETFAFYAVLNDPVYILKRELMWIPLFGWYMRKAGLIPIDRSAGMAALARMTARARAALIGAHPRQLVIFPVALNSGLFWPRRSLRKFPGTIIVEILDPIAPGLDKAAFFARLEDTIEQASARLIQESENRVPPSGEAASANGSHGLGSGPDR